MNQVVMSGTLGAMGALRFTPAGVPVAEFSLTHASVQQEAGSPRRVTLEVPTVAFGAVAQRVAAAQPAASVIARGFLAWRSQRSRQIVLHADTIEFE